MLPKKLESMLNRFQNKQNAAIAKQYCIIRKTIDKVSDATVENNLHALKALDAFMDQKSFMEATQDDMINWEFFLRNEYKSDSPAAKKGISETSMLLYESMIKHFYKYLFNQDEYRKGKQFQKQLSFPSIVSWMNARPTASNELPIDKIMTEDELLRLINACEHPRDQALIAVLYDAGLRIGEALALKIENVGFDKLGGYVILPKNAAGLKTGMRKIRLFIFPASSIYLKNFINVHPFKSYDTAPLFYSRRFDKFRTALKKMNRDKLTKKDLENLHISNDGFGKYFAKLVTAAGLSGITCHTLRHNSATQCAKLGFNEMELRIRYGWTKNSTMPSRYVHLASKDLDDKIKVITGFKEPEKEVKSKLIPITCWNCEEENVPTNKFCAKCGVKLQKTLEDEIPAADIGRNMKHMLKDEDFLLTVLNNLAKKLQNQQQ